MLNFPVREPLIIAFNGMKLNGTSISTPTRFKKVDGTTNLDSLLYNVSLTGGGYISELDLSGVKSMYGLFQGFHDSRDDKPVPAIPVLDLSSATNMADFIYNSSFSTLISDTNPNWVNMAESLLTATSLNPAAKTLKYIGVPEYMAGPIVYTAPITWGKLQEAGWTTGY